VVRNQRINESLAEGGSANTHDVHAMGGKATRKGHSPQDMIFLMRIVIIIAAIYD
jgi:hypothetical protein